MLRLINKWLFESPDFAIGVIMGAAFFFGVVLMIAISMYRGH